MLGVFTSSYVFYHNVVYVDLYSSAYQGFEAFYHQPLICSTDIFKPKRYSPIAIQPLWCHKDHLFLIWLEHGDLVVPEERVYEEEHFVPDNGIYYLVYSGKGKLSPGQASFKLV